MPKFVFLWTDLVLWLVVAAVIVYIWRARRNPRTRANWLHVVHQAPAGHEPESRPQRRRLAGDRGGGQTPGPLQGQEPP